MKRYLLIVFTLAVFIAPVARADEKADAILKEMEAATKATQTLTGDLTMSQQAKGQESKFEGTVKLKKPNFARIQFKGSSFEQTVASDGKTLWVLFGNQYQKKAADPQGRNIQALWGTPVSAFFNPPSSSKTRYVGTEKVDGTEYSVIEADIEQPYPHKLKLFIGPDKLLRGAMIEVMRQDEVIKLDAWLKNVKIGGNLPESDFAYEPPKTAKLYEPPDFNKLLLPIGQEAPDFSLPMLDGNKLSLSDARKGKRAVLVNFWFYS